jgi:hypothetical protein
MEHWRMLQAAIPAYRRYRGSTDRQIPIVRLRRVVSEWKKEAMTGGTGEATSKDERESNSARHSAVAGD